MPPRPLCVALLFNERPSRHMRDIPDDTFEEYDSRETIDGIARCLRELLVTVELVPADRRMAERLANGHFDFAFNIAEGPLDLSGRARRCREALPALVCEAAHVPYTGSDPLTLALTLDKAMARNVVASHVPVAKAVLIEETMDEEHLEPLLHALCFPVVVKPNDEGSSKGIHDDAIADDVEGAKSRARCLRQRYHCPVLVEEYLPGMEVTVAIAGNAPNERILGMMEIAPVVERTRFLYSLEVKRDFLRQVTYHVPPRLSREALSQLGTYALTAYRLLGCRDIARLDFRLNATGQPCFIECNPLPGLNAECSDLVIMTRSTLPYAAMVQGILREAARRCGVHVGGHEGAHVGAHEGVHMGKRVAVRAVAG